MNASLDAILTIDLDALAANYQTLVAQARGAEVAPVVKANGYGLGAVEVAERLVGEGARSLFVARVSEGVALRRALGRDPTIYVLDGCPQNAAELLKTSALIPVLNSMAQIADWGDGDAALMIDTGLNRLGVTTNEAQALMGRNFSAVMSHLACADDPANHMSQRQRALFETVATLFPDARRSLAASDGLFLGPEFGFDMVRTGICLYGGGPHGRPDPRIQPVATFEVPILQVRDLAPGDRVGYGASFTAPGPMRAAVAAVGYADGVLRSCGGAAYGSLDGQRCAVLGRISMDLTLYDVTNLPGARAGQMMQVIGPDVLVDDAARAAGTIAYELLTRLGARAERRYLARA